MRKLLLVGEHPGKNSGFGHLHKDIIEAFIDLSNFDEITSLGTLGSVTTKSPDLPCIFINSSTYTTSKGNIFGRDSIVKFLSDNKDYTDVLCMGDQWYYDGLPYTKALFGHRVTFHYYSPCEGEGLPNTVTSGSNTMGKEVNVQRVLKTFDQVIAYSQVSMKPLRVLSPDNVVDYVYHWTTEPSSEKEHLQSLVNVMEGRRVVGFIGRNVFRKSTDVLLKVASLLKGTDILIVAHVPKEDSFGWNFNIIQEQYPDAWDNIVFTEDLIPGLYFERQDNKLIRNLKLGLRKKHLEWLYSKFDVFINMSRAEGFGFPIIEAMIRGIPTIVNRYSSPKEIMEVVGTPDLAIEIAGEELFPMGVPGKMGMPDAEAFAHTIKKLLDNPNLHSQVKEIQSKGAREHFLKENTKHRQKIVSIVEDWDSAIWAEAPVISIDSYMDRCGIKTYTDNLFGKDYPFRIREKNIKEITDSLEFVNGRIFHIQFEPAMWPIPDLEHLIRTVSRKNKVVVTIHTEHKPFIKNMIPYIDHFIFHKEPTLVKIDKDKYTVIGHPLPGYAVSKETSRRVLGYSDTDIVIGLNGFALPYKKLCEQAFPVIQLIKRQPDKYKLLMVCSPHAKDALHTGKKIVNSIKNRAIQEGVGDKVQIIYEFLPAQDMSRALSAMDFGIMYHNLHTVGAQSGSVRELLGSGVIPVVTRSKVQTMHNDLIDDKVALAIQTKTQDELSVEDFISGALSAIEQYGNQENMEVVRQAIDKYREDRTFSKMAEQQNNIYKKIGDNNE